MIIGQGQIAMDPVKLTTICDWKPPASVKGIHSFLGFANFYHKFTVPLDQDIKSDVCIVREGDAN